MFRRQWLAELTATAVLLLTGLMGRAEGSEEPLETRRVTRLSEPTHTLPTF